MKIQRALIQICLLGTVLLGLPAVVRAQYFTAGDYYCETNSDGVSATILQYAGSGGSVSIPDTVQTNAESLPFGEQGKSKFSGSSAWCRELSWIAPSLAVCGALGGLNLKCLSSLTSPFI